MDVIEKAFSLIKEDRSNLNCNTFSSLLRNSCFGRRDGIAIDSVKQKAIKFLKQEYLEIIDTTISEKKSIISNYQSMKDYAKTKAEEYLYIERFIDCFDKIRYKDSGFKNMYLEKFSSEPALRKVAEKKFDTYIDKYYAMVLAEETLEQLEEKSKDSELLKFNRTRWQCFMRKEQDVGSQVKLQRAFT